MGLRTQIRGACGGGGSGRLAEGRTICRRLRRWSTAAPASRPPAGWSVGTAQRIGSILMEAAGVGRGGRLWPRQRWRGSWAPPRRLAGWRRQAHPPSRSPARCPASTKHSPGVWLASPAAAPAVRNPASRPPRSRSLSFSSTSATVTSFIGPGCGRSGPCRARPGVTAPPAALPLQAPRPPTAAPPRPTRPLSSAAPPAVPWPWRARRAARAFLPFRSWPPGLPGPAARWPHLICVAYGVGRSCSWRPRIRLATCCGWSTWT
jgi:hypothetical protein